MHRDYIDLGPQWIEEYLSSIENNVIYQTLINLNCINYNSQKHDFSSIAENFSSFTLILI